MILARPLADDRGDRAQATELAVGAEMFRRDYADVFTGDERWQSLEVPTGERYAWDGESTYVRRPPFFEGMAATPEPVTDVEGARVLAVLGDSVTTDHISPAGSIRPTSPAGEWLRSSTASRSPTSTPTAPGAATTR